MDKRLENFEAKYRKKEPPPFEIGDTVDVYFQVKEGDKARSQVFGGIVIARKGAGVNEMFTVRRISYGEGVERVFPLHSPLLEKVEITKKGKTRRAKLYYLRARRGRKATKVEEDVG